MGNRVNFGERLCRCRDHLPRTNQSVAERQSGEGPRPAYYGPLTLMEPEISSGAI